VPQPDRVDTSERTCCTIAPAPARHEDAAPQATAAQHPAPVLVAVSVAPLPAVVLDPGASRGALDPPRTAGPPIFRTTCSLLI